MSEQLRDTRRVTRDAAEEKDASPRSRTRHTALLITLTIASATLAHAELIDPTRPVTAHAAAAPTREIVAGVRLTAIFSSGERHVAVLDGKVVNVGDRVGDLIVKEITAEGVRYERAGRVEFVRLPTQAAHVRRPAAGAEEGQ